MRVKQDDHLLVDAKGVVGGREGFESLLGR